MNKGTDKQWNHGKDAVEDMYQKVERQRKKSSLVLLLLWEWWWVCLWKGFC